MLKITIKGRELWDEKSEEFIKTKDTVLQLEHSLVSISKWESKWHKPFLEKNEKTYEETLDYIRCMTLTQNVNPEVYNSLTQDVLDEIVKYIDDSMTATWFSKNDIKKRKKEIITSEIIYYWMIALNIPFECQKWHLNRLLTLIQVCNIKNEPPDKKRKSSRQIGREQAAINAARRKALHTRG